MPAQPKPKVRPNKVRATRQNDIVVGSITVLAGPRTPEQDAALGRLWADLLADDGVMPTDNAA